MKKIYLKFFLFLLMLFSSVNAGAKQNQHEQVQNKTFDKIRNNIETYFYDKSLNGLDWRALCKNAKAKLPVTESQFSELANNLLAKLHTSHTAYYSADSMHHALLLDVYRGNPALKALIKKSYGDRPYWETTGFFTTKIDGKIFINQLLAGSPAEKAGLKVGDEIIDVDSKSYHPVLSFKGKSGKQVSIRYRRNKNGNIKTTKALVVKSAPLKLFDEAAKNSIRIQEIEGKRIGYIRFWSLAGKEPTSPIR